MLTMIKMTFKQFQAGRQWSNDLSAVSDRDHSVFDDATTPASGWVYCDTLAIERVGAHWPTESQAEGNWYLMIGNWEKITDDLVSLERELYDFACSEGYIQGRGGKTPVTFQFDTGEPFEGFTDGTTWNGFTNVWVHPEIRLSIIETFEATGWWEPGDKEAMLSLPVDDDGLVSLAKCYATYPVPGANDTADEHRDDTGDTPETDALEAALDALIEVEGFVSRFDADPLATNWESIPEMLARIRAAIAQTRKVFH